MPDSLIRVARLTKSFGLRTVLREVYFQAQPGEIIALLGANGAGKTTLLRILATLTHATRGEVRVAGYSLPAQAVEARRYVGVVLHQPLVYDSLTAEENLRYYGRLYGVAHLEARIDELLDQVGLSARRRDRTAIFSRGMLQRLAIARAALHNPPIYLLDEPHSGLDPEACTRLESILSVLAARGALVIFTTHELERAEMLAARFDVLHQGRIAASCSRAGLPGGGLAAFYREVAAP
jgi:heme exporter protein A